MAALLSHALELDDVGVMGVAVLLCGFLRCRVEMESNIHESIPTSQPIFVLFLSIFRVISTDRLSVTRPGMPEARRPAI